MAHRLDRLGLWLDRLPGKFRSAWRKNGPDLRALLRGDLPSFVRGGELGTEIPVFVFHSVVPERLEAQFRYLSENGYRTLSGEELEAVLRDQASPGRSVVLTFDDAGGSFWAVALPLLRKYGFHAMLFVVPGLVPSDPRPLPNLESVWSGAVEVDELYARERIRPLCTWEELRIIHASGLVDLQSHSLNHARIHTGPELVDYIHPGFDPYFFGNVNIPLDSRAGAGQVPELAWGRPIYRSASRMSGIARFFEDPAINDHLVKYVGAHGGISFFSRPGWRKELNRVHRSITNLRSRPGTLEPSASTQQAICFEFVESKRVLEQQVPGVKVNHFCYPWFEGSTFSDRIAGRSGYDFVHYGLELPGSQAAGGDSLPVKIRRISEEYLFCLPGQGRQTLWDVWRKRAMEFASTRL